MAICVVAFLHVSRSLASRLMMLTEGSFMYKLSGHPDIHTHRSENIQKLDLNHSQQGPTYWTIINRPGKCNTFPNFSPSIVNKHDFSLWYRAILRYFRQEL